MGGGAFPIAFRGGPSGALNPNDFGSVRRNLLLALQSVQALALPDCAGQISVLDRVDWRYWAQRDTHLECLPAFLWVCMIASQVLHA